MPAAEVMIRPAGSPDEVDAFFVLTWGILEPGTSPDQGRSWRDRFVQAPCFDPTAIRGAFVGGRLVSGCIVHERLLRMGPARLRTGCVGNVATHPDYRHRGIASAVLRDATAFADARRYGLLLLDGVEGFYGRFGYVDVHDAAWHGVQLRQVLEQPPSPYRVRAATEGDAPALLSLYQRHYGHYPGSLERDLVQQTLQLRAELPHNAPALAIDPEGAIRGYLVFNWEHHGPPTREAAADDWPAALALLQHQARGLSGRAEPAAELLWPLPMDSPTFYLLADRFSLRTEIRQALNGGWMARVASVPELLRALVPLWQARWARCVTPWSGGLGLRLGSDRRAVCLLQLSPGRLEPLATGSTADAWVALTPGVFVQLLFGYRTVSWAASQQGVRMPERCLPALEALFPRQPACIPGSDFF